MRFSIDSPLCIDRVRSPSPVYDEYWFTPVLIWQPNKKKKERKEDDPNEEEKKNQSVLKTTNLTDTLPDLHVHHCKQQQPKVSVLKAFHYFREDHCHLLSSHIAEPFTENSLLLLKKNNY